MNIIELLKKELEQEALTTRKFLAIVPLEKGDWAPHEKSMKLKDLAVHLADLPSWVKMGLETDELDFATSPYNPPTVSTNQELLDFFEHNQTNSLQSLSTAKEADLTNRWVLRTGENIHADMNKYGIIRMALLQTTHHRAQLGVYLRLLNIPIPGSYGPSADEATF